MLAIQGADKLRAHLGRDHVGKAIRDILSRAGIIGEGAAKQTAPVDTGRLRASVTHHMAAQATHVAIGTNVEYARKLDRPPAGRTYHYRRGPLKGQEIAGWLSKSLRVVESKLPSIFAAVGNGVVKRWKIG